MSSVTYDFFQNASLGRLGEVVSADHLSTNFLFTRDQVTLGSDYETLSEQFDFGVLRFPGGTITERYFDLENPDRTGAMQNLIGALDNNGNLVSQDIQTGLSDFIAYAHQQGATVAFVLPTYQFFNLNAVGTADVLLDGAEATVKDFLRDLLSGAFGEAQISHLSIGNEFFNAFYQWTDAQFGALQAQMAIWIDEVVVELTISGDLVSDPIVLAQGSNGLTPADADAQNQVFIDEMRNAMVAEGIANPDLSDIIDGVAVHGYGASSNPLAIGGGLDQRFNSVIDTWMEGDPDALELAITEWNVGQSDTSVTGMERNASFIRIFAEMMEAGVDLANIWTVQNSAYSTLSREDPGSRGLPSSELTPTGYIFRMMSQNLQGTQMVDNENDFRLLDGQTATTGYTYAFSGAVQTVIYVASGTDTSFDLEMDLSGFMSGAIAVNATRLTAVPGQAVDALDVEGRIDILDRDELGLGIDNTLDLTLGAYDFVQVVITYDGNGVFLFGDDQNDIADLLEGTDFADTLIGGRSGDTLEGGIGDDTLEGGHGDDLIEGGEGDDLIDGGGNQDNIIAGHGNDTVLGGDGRDTAYLDVGNDIYFDSGQGGSSGMDSVFGGAGNDSIETGGGDDVLEGDAGADSLFGGAGNDRITGGAGFDHLYGDAGNDVLSGGSETDWMYGGDGNDLMFGGTNANQGTDRLYGGAGADTMFGDAGFDYLEGGTGNDVMDGGAQADNLFGQAGNDMVYGGDGLDRLFGGGGDDLLSGGDGNDGHFGENGDDSAYGGAGDDRFFGGLGDDLLLGEDGQDTLYGDAGFDTLDGGAGSDLLFGRFNADTFVFSDGHGHDTVADFDATNDIEKLDLTALSGLGSVAEVLAAASQDGADVVIITNANSSIRLRNVDINDLDSADFIF